MAGRVVAGGNREVHNGVGADEADFGVVVLLLLFPLLRLEGGQSCCLRGLVGVVCRRGAGRLSVPSASASASASASPPSSTPCSSPAAVSLTAAPLSSAASASSAVAVAPRVCGVAVGACGPLH